jgi:hypothetical protein
MRNSLAFIPLSIIFEIIFFFLGIILYRENLTLERLVAVGLFFFEIPILIAPQEFFVENSGILTNATVSIPSGLLGYLIFADFLLIFIALYRWWDLYDAQKNAKETARASDKLHR